MRKATSVVGLIVILCLVLFTAASWPKTVLSQTRANESIEAQSKDSVVGKLIVITGYTKNTNCTLQLYQINAKGEVSATVREKNCPLNNNILSALCSEKLKGKFYTVYEYRGAGYVEFEVNRVRVSAKEIGQVKDSLLEKLKQKTLDSTSCYQKEDESNNHSFMGG